jgi:DHA1 family tetracycline resistance protein-like MFS transporter
MIPGFTGGNIAILTSSIADISDKESRTRNFGLIGMAFGIGFILGPTIGGVLSDNTVVPWFDHYVPFLFTAGLALVNFILVYFFFKETLLHKLQTSISPFKGVQNIFTSFSSPNLRAVFTVVFLISVGFTFYTQFFSVYLLEKFDFKEKEIGLLYGYIGVWLAIVQGVLVRYLSYRMPPKNILMGSLPLLALALGLVLLPTSGWMFYVVNPLIAIAYGITSPNVTSIVSSQADETLQGSILGINQSMLSLGQMITPVIGGVLVGINIHYPLIASATIIVLAAVIFYISRSKILYDGKA